MDTEGQELNFKCLCRTCMQPTQQQWHYISNTEEVCDSMSIADLLTRILPQLKLNLSEELPQRICKICVECLLNAYRFQEMCLQSEQQLCDLVANSQLDVKFITKTEAAPKMSSLSEPVVEPGGIEASNAPNNAIPTEDPLQNNEESEKMSVVLNTLGVYVKTEQLDDEYHSANYVIQQEYTGSDKVPNIKIEMDTPTDVLVIETKSNTNDDVSSHEDASDRNGKIKKTIVRSKMKYSNGKKSSKIMLNSPLTEKTEEASSTYDCNICKKSFIIRGYLLKHLRRHKKSEEQNSRKRTKGLELEFLEKHKQTHSQDVDEKIAAAVKKIPCNFCEKKYGSQCLLARHLRQKHCEQYSRTSDNRYTCEICDKSYKQSATLKDHMRTHTGEQPYLCSECGKAFTTLSNMKQHLLRHGGDKPYECPDCPKKFPTISDLASHKVMHRQIKPHVCDICGNAFGKAYQLKKHKMYHNGEKPHKCEYCEMRFVCKDHLRRHMRTHTGEKPYKCKYCERAFAQSNDLIKHLRTHLGEKVYKCELCPNSFRLASELRVHFAEHKHDDEETRARNMQALADEEAKLCASVKTGNCQQAPQEVPPQKQA